MLNKKKIGAIIFVALLSIGLIIFSNNYLGHPKLIIVNVGTKDINSIHVTVTGNEYFIDALEKGEETVLRINPKSDSDILITTENKKHTLIINTYLDRASTGGYIKAEITTDSLISFVHKRGLL
ncbi:MAG: hypothetical protein WD512_00405 [Candidatus Paceibacterota bacterium]